MFGDARSCQQMNTAVWIMILLMREKNAKQMKKKKKKHLWYTTFIVYCSLVKGLKMTIIHSLY